MPRLSKAVPKYRKHRASGQAVVTLNGKDHYLGPHGSKTSKRLYDRLIAEWLSGGRRLPVAEQDDEFTVVHLLAAYWRHARMYYRKNGKPTNELDAFRVILRDIKELYGDIPAADFGPRALKAVRQVWIDRGQVRTTVNKNQRRVVRIFRWAVSEDLVPGSVVESLRSVPGLRKGRSAVPEAPPILPVDIETVEQTIPHMLPVTADMVRFQLLTGARPGEVCSLRPSDIDRSGDVWEYRVEGHKTEHHGRHRVVYIGPAAQAVLKPYLLRPATSHCFSAAEAMKHRRERDHANRTTPLSCGNRPGKRYGERPTKGCRPRRAQDHYTPSSYRRAIHNACDSAFPPPEPLAKRSDETWQEHGERLSEREVEALKQWQSEHRWSPNQLRHTKATEIRKRFGLEAAQVILGHAAADVTQVYAERDAEKAREVARTIG